MNGARGKRLPGRGRMESRAVRDPTFLSGREGDTSKWARQANEPWGRVTPAVHRTLPLACRYPGVQGVALQERVGSSIAVARCHRSFAPGSAERRGCDARAGLASMGTASGCQPRESLGRSNGDGAPSRRPGVRASRGGGRGEIPSNGENSRRQISSAGRSAAGVRAAGAAGLTSVAGRWRSAGRGVHASLFAYRTARNVLGCRETAALRQRR